MTVRVRPLAIALLAPLLAAPAAAEGIETGTFSISGPQLIYQNLQGAKRDVMITVCNVSSAPAGGLVFVNFPGHPNVARIQLNNGSCGSAIFTSQNGDTVVLQTSAKTASGTYSIAFL